MSREGEAIIAARKRKSELKAAHRAKMGRPPDGSERGRRLWRRGLWGDNIDFADDLEGANRGRKSEVS